MITVSDLKDQTSKGSRVPVLHCKCCGTDCSANAVDYFSYPPTYPFTCCDKPMILAVRKVVYEEVR